MGTIKYELRSQRGVSVEVLAAHASTANEFLEIASKGVRTLSDALTDPLRPYKPGHSGEEYARILANYPNSAQVAETQDLAAIRDLVFLEMCLKGVRGGRERLFKVVGEEGTENYAKAEIDENLTRVIIDIESKRSESLSVSHSQS